MFGNEKIKNNGITLIALVVTIVILLILAGFSISMLTGNYTILTKAKDAKNSIEKASIEEQIALALQGSLMENGKNDINELNKNLKEINGISGLPITKLPNRISVNNEIYEIDENGKVSIVPNDEYRKISLEEAEDMGLSVNEAGILQANNVVLNKYLEKTDGKLVIPSEIDGKQVKILAQALKGNVNIKEVVLSLGLQDIQWGAFQSCPNLQKCNIPNGVTHIGNYVFNNTSIESVYIPSTVSNIENKTTFSASTLKNIMVDSNNNYYCSENGLLLSKDKTQLISLAGAIEEITLLKSITKIESKCFYANNIIKKIKVERGSKLAQIGQLAFINTVSLCYMELPVCFKTLEGGNFLSSKGNSNMKFIVGSEEVKNLLINYEEGHGKPISENQITVDSSIN